MRALLQDLIGFVQPAFLLVQKALGESGLHLVHSNPAKSPPGLGKNQGAREEGVLALCFLQKRQGEPGAMT